MFQHMIGDHHVVGLAGHRKPGYIHLVRNPGLPQIRCFIPGVIAQRSPECLLRGEMQDTLANELIVACPDGPQPQKPMPLPAAASRATSVPTRRMTNADHDAVVAADWTQPA